MGDLFKGVIHFFHWTCTSSYLMTALAVLIHYCASASYSVHQFGSQSLAEDTWSLSYLVFHQCFRCVTFDVRMVEESILDVRTIRSWTRPSTQSCLLFRSGRDFVVLARAPEVS